MSARACAVRLDALVDAELPNVNDDKCYQCNGSGIINVTVTKLHSNKPPKPSSRLPCMTCDGSGSLTPAQIRTAFARRLVWCQCADSKDNITPRMVSSFSAMTPTFAATAVWLSNLGDKKTRGFS